MSHDLKAPSNTLNLLLTELKTDHLSELNDDARELINHSMTTSNRMQALLTYSDRFFAPDCQFN